jgi:hypothetical protein
MTPTEARNMIAAAGGDSAFARIIGIAEDDGALQRVNNWKRRGIPAGVFLEHYEALSKLRAETAAEKRRRA